MVLQKRVNNGYPVLLLNLVITTKVIPLPVAFFHVQNALDCTQFYLLVLQLSTRI